MRIIALRTLRGFWQKHADAEARLRAWHQDAKQARWRTPQDIVDVYRNASIVANNRVVFNIKGNDYRLVVEIHYNTGVVFIRFIGTHEDYDDIDAENV